MAKEEQVIIDPSWWIKNRGIPYSPEVFSGWGDHPSLDESTRQAVSPLVTNLGRPIMAFTSLMPQEVGAAAITRYSRVKNPIRLIIADELLDKNGLNLARAADTVQITNREAANDYFARVASGYGDDSPEQLGSVQIAAEMISQMAVKELEDARIGVSFIEKSTRYVDFTKKVNGEYLYLRPPEIMASPHAQEFTQLMDEAFTIVAKATPGLLRIIREKFPRGNEDEVTWKASTRSKTFDILRVFFPMATLTNVGGSLDGQAAENTFNKGLVSWSGETRMVVRDLVDEVNQVIPSLNRVDGKYGEAAREFLRQRSAALAKVVKELRDKGLIKDVEIDQVKPEMRVKLKYATSGNVDRVVAGLLFPNERMTDSLLSQVASLPTVEKQKVIEAGFTGRTNRRHKPPRAFEKAYYEFDIRCQVAEWRDLQRMRMDTLQRQLLTTETGYGQPAEFSEVEIDFAEKKMKLSEIQSTHMTKRSELYRKVSRDISPEVAQFVTAFGNFMDWEMGVNLRQLYHLIPLRAGEGSHPLYKQIVLRMLSQVPSEDALLTLQMLPYLDLSSEDRLDRLKQLERVRQKQLAYGHNDTDTFAGE